MLLDVTERYVRRYQLQTRTYVLPCILPHAKGEASFQIGPVGFLPTDVFFQRYRGAVDESIRRTEHLWLEIERGRNLSRPSPSERSSGEPRNAIHEAAEQWVQDFRHIFSSYPWIATVEIKSCTSDMGQTLAQRAVGTALDALRLTFGRDRAYNIRLGGGFRLEAKTAHATLNTQGDLDITFSQTWESSGLPDDWLDRLGRPSVDPLMVSLGSLIRRMTAGGLLPPLYQRVVDSLAWYGEAVSGPEPHTCILRCMTALERFLVTPGRGKSSREKVKERGILLCSILEPGKEQWCSDAFA